MCLSHVIVIADELSIYCDKSCDQMSIASLIIEYALICTPTCAEEMATNAYITFMNAFRAMNCNFSTFLLICKHFSNKNCHCHLALKAAYILT